MRGHHRPVGAGVLDQQHVAAARTALLGSGAPDWFVEALLEINANMAGGSADVVTSTVRDVAGRDPRSFETFATDYASAFRPAD